MSKKQTAQTADQEEAIALTPEELQAKLRELEEENAAIKEVNNEQAEKLAAHEKLSDHVTTKVAGKLYAVQNDLRIDGKKVTKKEIAADEALCKKLVAKGSHTLMPI